ncbi:MAG: aminotransferase class V-fold PLP-dependent enzyme [Bacillota bacterium]|nr:aminotransferase class V-fold PLP-dependent enzyme [Bacillota bacterium]
MAVVHAETSTGVLQPLESIAAEAQNAGALMVVDAVTSLGGVELQVDTLGLDVVYSGSQKCLSCPPGLAPITVSERAAKVIGDRRSPVQSWYLDLSMIQRYWTQERFYHHTAPINMIYGLHEALRIISEEGLESCWQRHLANSEAFCAGLHAIGLHTLVSPANRLPSLISVKVPDGIDEAAVRRTLLTEFNIEIGGGLGELKGRIWRFGLMGHGSRERNVLLLLVALEKALQKHGWTS